MKQHPERIRRTRFVEWPDDEADLPVLTDVIEPVYTPGQPVLWLAWDGQRVPVLHDVVEEDAAPAIDHGAAAVRRRPTEGER